MKNISANRTESEKDSRFLIEQHSALCNKRIMHNTALWNTPILFFSAQSFLFIVMLNLTFVWWARAVAAFVSVLFGLLSIQLFERHRIHELSDTLQIQDIERYMKSIHYKTAAINGKIIQRRFLDGTKLSAKLPNRNAMNSVNSTMMWRVGLWISVGVSAAFFVGILLRQSGVFDLFLRLCEAMKVRVDEKVLPLIFLCLAFAAAMFVYRFAGRYSEKKTPSRRLKIIWSVCLFLILALIFGCSSGVFWGAVNVITALALQCAAWLLTRSVKVTRETNQKKLREN